MPSQVRAAPAQAAPHSWSVDNWPAHVYPHSPPRGRYVVRANRTALISAGALTRIGRDLVVLGAPYVQWLRQQAERVEGYEIAPNRMRQDERKSA